MVGLSAGEKHFIHGGIAQDLRSDGRKRLQFRPIFFQTGVIPQAELGKPSFLRPDKGKVSIFVDCSPTAEPAFEGRGGEELSTELSVGLERCLLGGKSGAGTSPFPLRLGTSFLPISSVLQFLSCLCLLRGDGFLGKASQF
ncbi:hypothetical protein HPP92_016911 [Vanilla planifolia]|uniref:Ribosomal RNA-processing protein 42 n=1 Tax=Vanilla planifolia TaxID=51239 RepID=A0A835QBS4_VANPL|nr:hypothetical protein HPP92_016911 [Vanilla planifolia]